MWLPPSSLNFLNSLLLTSFLLAAPRKHWALKLLCSDLLPPAVIGFLFYLFFLLPDKPPELMACVSTFSPANHLLVFCDLASASLALLPCLSLLAPGRCCLLAKPKDFTWGSLSSLTSQQHAVVTHLPVSVIPSSLMGSCAL